MKYWLFQNNQVVGPHDREELAQTPGFCAESLVCPEGRKGTQMGDWQRAGVVAELAEVLLRSAKIPAAALAGDTGGFLPPEPTLRDLAVLGSLQEKVTLLESVLTQLQEDLRSRDQETADLKVTLELKAQETSALQSKLEAVEGRLAAAEALKDELARTQQAERETAEELKREISKTQEDERAVAQAQSAQAEALDDIKKRLEAAQEDLKRQLESVDKKQREALISAPSLPPLSVPSPIVPAPLPVPTPLPGAPLPLEKLPPLEAPALEPPKPAADSLFVPPPPLEALPSEPMTGGVPPAPAPAPAPVSAPIKEASPVAAEGVIEDLSSAPVKKASKGKLVVIAILLVVSAAAGAAYHLGFLDPYLGKKPAVAPEATLPTPEQPAPLETARQGLPDRTQAAVELVKNRRAPGSIRTLSERLEGINPAPGLSPWTVDRVDDATHEVSFYDRASDSKTPKYRFRVLLDRNEVQGLDPLSQVLLDSDEQTPKPAAKPKKAPAARKEAPAKKKAPKDELLQDPLGAMLMESSFDEEKAASPKKKMQPVREDEEAQAPLPPEEPSERPAARPKQAVKSPAKKDPLEDLVGEDEQPTGDLKAPSEPAARAPAPAPKKARKAAVTQKSKEELTLDELLLPGIPKQEE